MKKFIKIVSVFVFALLLFTTKVDAKTLDCSKYLSSGSKGENVKELQEMLNKVTDCNLEVDGVFGTLTSKCVKTFQSKYNLGIDGIVGPNTCAKLNALVNTSNVPKNRIYVTVNRANIRKSPTTNSEILTTVSLGKSIRLIKKVDYWYKVKISNEYGYIRSDLVSKNVIIVDISEQILYYNEAGNNILATPVVTGMKGKHDTPVGKYVLKVENLRRDKTLEGVNDNGSKYKADVDYWMPFITDRGIGFHDATWRSSSEFNRSTYINDGSHGCVNMQYAAAKTLYNSITEDTAVIIKK